MANTLQGEFRDGDFAECYLVSRAAARLLAVFSLDLLFEQLLHSRLLFDYRPLAGVLYEMKFLRTVRKKIVDIVLLPGQAPIWHPDSKGRRTKMNETERNVVLKTKDSTFLHFTDVIDVVADFATTKAHIVWFIPLRFIEGGYDCVYLQRPIIEEKLEQNKKVISVKEKGVIRMIQITVAHQPKSLNLRFIHSFINDLNLNHEHYELSVSAIVENIANFDFSEIELGGIESKYPNWRSRCYIYGWHF